jgi:hypothetical protein
VNAKAKFTVSFPQLGANRPSTAGSAFSAVQHARCKGVPGLGLVGASGPSPHAIDG